MSNLNLELFNYNYLKKIKSERKEETVPPEIIFGIVAGYNLAYEVGHTYEYDDIIAPSTKGNLGYKFCVGSPLKILDRLAILDSKCKPLRFFEVSAFTDNVARLLREDAFVTSKINIERELSFEALVRKQIEYTKSIPPNNQFYKQFDNRKNDDIIVSYKDDYKLFSNNAYFVISGDRNIISTTGTNAKIYSIGFESRLILVWDDGEIIASGEKTELHATGSKANLIAMGQDSEIFARGSNSTLISIGDNSGLTAYGDSARCICKGKKNSIHIEAKNGQFCAVEGTEVQIANYNSAHERQDDLFAIIGENNVKPDTWYAAKNGKFVEWES